MNNNNQIATRIYMCVCIIHWRRCYCRIEWFSVVSAHLWTICNVSLSSLRMPMLTLTQYAQHINLLISLHAEVVCVLCGVCKRWRCGVHRSTFTWACQSHITCINVRIHMYDMNACNDNACDMNSCDVNACDDIYVFLFCCCSFVHQHCIYNTYRVVCDGVSVVAHTIQISLHVNTYIQY